MALVSAYAALHLACAPVLLYTYGKPQQRAMSVDIHHLADAKERTKLLVQSAFFFQKNRKVIGSYG